MLGPGNARWLCLSLSFSRRQFSRFSRACVYPNSPPFLPLPFLSPLTSTTPLPRHCLCLPRSPRLSRSRVLLTRTRFSSPLSSIRAGLPAPTHPPPHDGEGCQGGEENEGVGGGGTVGSGRDGRTGPTHRSRDIHFHFIFLARYRRQKSRKKERKKEKRTARTLWGGSGQEKFRPFPRERVDRSGLLHPVNARANRANSNSRLHSRRKKRTRREGYIAGAAGASHSCGCVSIKR